MKYDSIVKDIPYTELDKLCKDTHKTKTINTMFNFDGDLVWVNFNHKILIANGTEVTSIGCWTEVTREKLKGENQ